MDANKIIDDIGGTSFVADMCGITTGAVSQWRTSANGIPKPWLKFFQEKRPDVFKEESAPKDQRTHSEPRDVLSAPMQVMPEHRKQQRRKVA